MELVKKSVVILGVCLILFISRGCAPSPEEKEDGTSRDRTELVAWAHHGKPGEWKTILDQVARFNRSHGDIRIKLVEIPEGNYDTQVQAAAAAGKLPHILEFDGPMLANYVWKGFLQPIGDLISPGVRQALLPSILDQGSYRGQLYAVGAFDSGLAIYADRRMLRAVGARIPQGIGDPWSVEEFSLILARLAARNRAEGKPGYALDIKRDYRGEWWTYGFYPALVSGGANLVDTEGGPRAAFVLNSPGAVAVLSRFQAWSQKGYIAPNTDGRAFIDRRAALSWVGHWEYPRYAAAMGEDLVLVPLPDFGRGSCTAMGSWCWGITRNCRKIKAAVSFLEFLLSDPEVLAMSRANGAVPGTRTAVEKSEIYGTGGKLSLFAEQLTACAVPRVKTPAYPVVTSVFQESMVRILDGAGVKDTLDRACTIIDRAIRENEGFRPPHGN